jgi:hypothetical protein
MTRHMPIVVIAAGLLGALGGCRTPFNPPTVPIANLYPTLHPGSILDQSRAVVAGEAEVTAVLVRLGLLEPLRRHGMGPAEVPLVVRGLERHGYAELDARRSSCPVHWVVLRGVSEAGATWLVLEAGLAAAPAWAAASGMNLGAAPATAGSRTDVYGRRSQVETWRGALDGAPVAVRRVTSPGRPVYWEVEYRQPAAPTPVATG